MSHAGDLLIRGGRVCDGSGREPFPADLLVREGRIERVTPRSESFPGGPGVRESVVGTPADARVITAEGLVIAPGFIDLHSHADLIHPLGPERSAPLLEGRLRQGITTEIVGNCGLGPAPCTDASGSIVRGVLSWMTPESGGGTWTTVGGYLEALDRAGLVNNVGTLLAHGAVRLAAMGLRAGAAGHGELREMTAAVEQAIEEGAFGLSSGLIYPPGMFTPMEELSALARPVARADRLYTSHVRGSSELLFDSVDELLAIGRSAGCRVHHSHNEAVGRAHWWKIDRVLEREEAARRAGIRVSYDMFPYTVAATMMLAIYPPWSLEGGPARLLERLAVAALRERIRTDVESVRPSWPPWREKGWPHNLVSAVGYEGIRISRVSSETARRFEGMTLAELGRARGRSPFDAISDLMIEERGEIGQWVFEISGGEPEDDPGTPTIAAAREIPTDVPAGLSRRRVVPEGLRLLAADPSGAFCTDAIDTGRGLPHPAAFGAFPRVLGRLVREQRLLSLGEAIRKMTSLPASLLGLRDRGRIETGARADLVLLDPETVTDGATLTAPRRPPAGIPWVLVNGTPVIEQGRYVPSACGRALRAGSDD